MIINLVICYRITAILIWIWYKVVFHKTVDWSSRVNHCSKLVTFWEYQPWNSDCKYCISHVCCISYHMTLFSLITWPCIFVTWPPVGVARQSLPRPGHKQRFSHDCQAPRAGVQDGETAQTGTYFRRKSQKGINAVQQCSVE